MTVEVQYILNQAPSLQDSALYLLIKDPGKINFFLIAIIKFSFNLAVLGYPTAEYVAIALELFFLQ